MRPTRATAEVIVIGSGPAGLSCAAELVRRGVPAVVLERGDWIAAAWAGRYDGLRLNTSRLLSALPGAPFPRELGQFLTRDQYVHYLERYADDRGVRVEIGIEVLRLEPDGDGDGWVVQTGAGTRRAHDVVVATGIFTEPVIPDWATAPGFGGSVVHTSAYRDAQPYVGQDVVVVGAGSTGMEIARELVEAGARSVHLSFRSPPNILLRVMGGLPGDLPVPVFLHLPEPVVDRILRRVQRTFVGDLAPYGLPTPTEGVIAGLRRRGAGTAIVDAETVGAIKDGSIRPVPAVAALAPGEVVLVDGTRLRADAVLLATGFRTGLEGLVGHLDVLDERGMPREGSGGEVLPGLRFVGYVYRPGIIGHAGRHARRVAREVSGRRSGARRAGARRAGARRSADRVSAEVRA